LMDIDLGDGMSGIDCIRSLRGRHPQMQFLMLTVYEDDDKIFSALKAGASGYLLKKSSPAKLLDAIRELHEGGSPMSSEIARRVVDTFQQSNEERLAQFNLSPREKEIAELLAKGLLYKEIADKLIISTETVRRHCHNIYKELHVSNRTEAMNKLYKN
jgi:DNA-binding NarL/FixJ family response regulator